MMRSLTMMLLSLCHPLIGDDDGASAMRNDAYEVMTRRKGNRHCCYASSFAMHLRLLSYVVKRPMKA